MLAYINRMRPAACVAIGALTLALGYFTEAQACHRGGGGGYPGNAYSNGQSYGQDPQGYGSTQQGYSDTQQGYSDTQQGYSDTQQGYSAPQQGSGGKVSLNNPATVLAYQGDLNLASNQVLALERMAVSGKQHAANVLTAVQRKQLAVIVGIIPASAAMASSKSADPGASALVGTP